MSPSYLFILFIALCAFTHVLGDLYMQNPRGSNDRLNEDGDRDNANRLFDSQNNARGGYCYGPALTYIEGSELSIQWTNQHACGNGNTDCQLIMQYMCTSDSANAPATEIIRDGTTTNTIPTTAAYQQKNADGTYVYGMNEDNAYITACQARSRNLNLYTATQNVVNNQGALATRQNPTGTRSGYECQEERDYYPYWHPSPWKDIAVLTNDVTECPFFQSQSQNVLAKNYCAPPAGGTDPAANNEAACIAPNTWTSSPAFGIAAPDCQAAPVNRDNHLGNGVDGNTNTYNWTLPAAAQEDCIDNGNCTCVLRMRYNITLGEITGNETVADNKTPPAPEDPNVNAEDTVLTLAIDTSQTGRTFQDRSFMFRIAPLPANLANVASAGGKIYNLNVRGKRGNIVQTYPATEYDFVPTTLQVTNADAINMQWTGCDTNPADNAGEGQDSTDRSNIVALPSISNNLPLNDSALTGAAANVNGLFQQIGAKVRTRLAYIDQTGCKNAAALQAIANKGGTAVDQNTANCMLLNAASPHFTGVTVTMAGVDAGDYPYMSTRNNNFSNRSQKATIRVMGPSSLSTAAKGGIAAGVVVAAVAVGALVGTIAYARRNPNSRAADIIGKIPVIGRM